MFPANKKLEKKVGEYPRDKMLKLLFFGLVFFMGVVPKASYALDEPSCYNLMAEAMRQKFSYSKLFIGQEDPQFKAYQLLVEGEESQLCGITSLANLINLKLSKNGLAMDSKSLVEFISQESLAFSDSKWANGDRHFSILGMYSFDLAELAQSLVKKLKLPFTVRSKSLLLADQDILLSDLKKAKGSLWSIQFMNKKNEYGPSHFILVLSYDAKNGRIVFSDPLEPQIRKMGHVTFPKKGAEAPGILVDIDPKTDMHKLVGEEEGFFTLSGIVNFE